MKTLWMQATMRLSREVETDSRLMKVSEELLMGKLIMLGRKELPEFTPQLSSYFTTKRLPEMTGHLAFVRKELADYIAEGILADAAERKGE
jgi:hypothetical protein